MDINYSDKKGNPNLSGEYLLHLNRKNILYVYEQLEYRKRPIHRCDLRIVQKGTLTKTART